MKVGGNEYAVRELAGAFGDLGTLIPFLVGYITISKMDLVGVLVAFGLFKIIAGLYFSSGSGSRRFDQASQRPNIPRRSLDARPAMVVRSAQNPQYPERAWGLYAACGMAAASGEGGA